MNNHSQPVTLRGSFVFSTKPSLLARVLPGITLRSESSPSTQRTQPHPVSCPEDFQGAYWRGAGFLLNTSIAYAGHAYHFGVEQLVRRPRRGAELSELELFAEGAYWTIWHISDADKPAAEGQAADLRDAFDKAWLALQSIKQSATDRTAAWDLEFENLDPWCSLTTRNELVRLRDTAPSEWARGYMEACLHARVQLAVSLGREF